MVSSGFGSGNDPRGWVSQHFRAKDLDDLVPASKATKTWCQIVYVSAVFFKMILSYVHIYSESIKDYVGVSIVMGVPLNGWFIRENPI